MNATGTITMREYADGIRELCPAGHPTRHQAGSRNLRSEVELIDVGCIERRGRPEDDFSALADRALA